MPDNAPLTMEAAWKHVRTWIAKNVRYPSRAGESLIYLLEQATADVEETEVQEEVQEEVEEETSTTSLDDTTPVDALADHDIQKNVIDALKENDLTLIGQVREILKEKEGALSKGVSGIGEATEKALRELLCTDDDI